MTDDITETLRLPQPDFLANEDDLTEEDSSPTDTIEALMATAELKQLLDPDTDESHDHAELQVEDADVDDVSFDPYNRR